ncbi:MAG TPA: tetratricopeptide repeat protein, partial [Longimicrobiales bacterium]|nr:tetratricopeptide repeat protein [Longimicrobiales bacterium]
TFDRDLSDVFDVQAEVARTIASTLEVELTPGQRASLTRSRATSAEAYEAYLQGRFFWSRRTRQGLERAIELFDRALAIDPEYAPANAGLAEAFLLLPQYGSMPVSEAVPRARRAAEAALADDPTLASAHAALGFILNNHDRDWRAAEGAFRRAIELDPSYVTAHHWYGLTLLFQGRVEDAVAEITRARELDPLSVIVASDAGLVYRLSRRPREAVAALERVVELDPSLGEAHVHLGLARIATGSVEEGLDDLERSVELMDRHPLALAMLGAVRAESGDLEGSHALLAELERREADGEFVSPALRGILRGYGGDVEAMFADLRAALEARDLIFMTVLLDPMLRDRFGVDPRWDELLRLARGP